MRQLFNFTVLVVLLVLNVLLCDEYIFLVNITQSNKIIKC